MFAVDKAVLVRNWIGLHLAGRRCGDAGKMCLSKPAVRHMELTKRAVVLRECAYHLTVGVSAIRNRDILDALCEW